MPLRLLFGNYRAFKEVLKIALVVQVQDNQGESSAMNYLKDKLKNLRVKLSNAPGADVPKLSKCACRKL